MKSGWNILATWQDGSSESCSPHKGPLFRLCKGGGRTLLGPHIPPLQPLRLSCDNNAGVALIRVCFLNEAGSLAGNLQPLWDSHPAIVCSVAHCRGEGLLSAHKTPVRILQPLSSLFRAPVQGGGGGGEVATHGPTTWSSGQRQKGQHCRTKPRTSIGSTLPFPTRSFCRDLSFGSLTILQADFVPQLPACLSRSQPTKTGGFQDTVSLFQDQVNRCSCQQDTVSFPARGRLGRGPSKLLR